jgi:hypothetical protein
MKQRLMPLVSLGLLAMTSFTASDFLPHRRKAFRVYPIPTAGLLGWWKADSITQSDNTVVTTWEDSHTNEDLAQATTTNKPTFQTGEINGLPIVRFDGVDNWMRSDMAINAGANLSFYAVLKQTNSISDQRNFTISDGGADATDAQSAILYYLSGGSSISPFYAGSYYNDGFAIASPTTAFLYESIWGAGSLIDYRNGVAGTAYTPTATFNSTFLNVGIGWSGSANVGTYASMDLAEVLLYATTHSAATRNSIETYLSTKWGTPAPPGASVTQNFDAYTDSTSLATFSGWTVAEGAFRTGAAASAGSGEVTSNTAATVCSAIYEPAGFTCSTNHQVEVTLDTEATGGTQAQGAAVAIQASGACYHCFVTSFGDVYLGVTNASGAGSEYVSTSVSSFVLAGFKIRMTVSGTSPARAVTAEYNNGAGWVTPSGWSAKVFTSQLAAGKGGISGYSADGGTSITSLTITNQ